MSRSQQVQSRASIAVLTAALMSVGCRSQPSDAAVAERARASIAPFKAALKDALTRAMAESPESAIAVCSEKAPELAKAHSKDGVVAGRSAHKLRNAANAPRPWLQPVMARLAKAPSGSDAHEVVKLPEGRYGYAEAIWVQAPCLACHGASIAPGIAQKLDAKYPHDEARGFAEGDFRGVFWAEIDGAALPH
ncbi:MAG: DUF3365 domain-containing protein [Deltaproteobacteria bacterium]|nr:DUF3365 domain-containing protein [Deltaproteobacteria bacterium]